MDNRITEILGSSKSKVSTNTDVYTNIQFKGAERLLPNNDINSVLDITSQFNIERQSCTYYRILGKLNPLMSNVLFNITGNTSSPSWEIFNSSSFTDVDSIKSQIPITYAESIKNNLKEVEGWYGYYDTKLQVKSLCNFNDMEPTRERFSFLPDITGVNNWHLTITYPYATDTTHNLVKGGLLIATSTNIYVGGKLMTAIYIPIPHNLSSGDRIQLSGTNKDGIYDVKNIGLEDGSYKANYFSIDIINLNVSNNSRISKIYNDVPSIYYFRKFKKVNTKAGSLIQTSDYEIYNLGFSESIFTDNITQFIFNEEIDINGLYDNLGRPLSELYLTSIKTDSNGIFTNVSSGLEVQFSEIFNSGLNYLDSIPVIQKMHNVSTSMVTSSIPLESNVNIANSDYYGDLVEYNTTTIQEVILADIHHRFNTVNRETTSGTTAGGPRPEGYYYKAHNLIRIRDFSSYIEQGASGNTIGIPSYAENLGDGRYIWRDLLDIGFTDINKPVLNYPFLNGAHYMYQNYNFIVKRQDAFSEWGMYYSIFPADPIGDTISSKFKINSSDNVC